MMLNGTPQTTFVRKQNRLYIHGDFADGDIIAGKYIVAEVYQEINDSDYTTVWNDLWLKEYTTALFKQQWGQNLIKFEGMVLPGGVTLNGRQIYDDASRCRQTKRKNKARTRNASRFLCRITLWQEIPISDKKSNQNRIYMKISS